MKDEIKTKEQLIEELGELRQRISDLKAAASRRKRRDDLSKIVLASMKEAVCIIDVSDFTIVGCNSAFSTEVGLRQDEAVEKTCYELTHGRSAPCAPPDHVCPLQSTVATGRRSTAEHLHYDQHGEQRYVEISASPLTDDNGKTTQVLYTALDITARKQAEEALRQRERELTTRNQIDRIFLTIPDNEMYGEALEVILEATGSEYGIFGYIDEDGALVCPSLSRDVWENCQVVDKAIRFPRETWGGIWGRALRLGESLLSNEPGRVPEGHVPIYRIIVVPIRYDTDVIGVITVGNKETDYDEHDKKLLEGVANNIAPVLHARLERNREERERRRAEEALTQHAHALGERVKELNCLYNISELVEKPSISLEGILQGVVNLIPRAWQYPEITCARLTLKDQEFQTENWEVTTWQQTSHIAVRGERVGPVQVCYLEERPESDEGPFLKEERDLINAIAERLGRIIQRNQAEEASRRERENIINILEAIRDGVYIVNEEHDIQYVNAALEEEFGPPEGKRCYEYFHDRTKVCPWCKNEDVFAGKTVRWEWYSFKNERTYDLIDTPLTNPDGTVSKLEIFRDITERKRAEDELTRHRQRLEELVDQRTAELRQSEESFRALAENANDGIVIFSGEGALVYANARAGEITGYHAAELLGMTVRDLAHPDEFEKLVARIRKRVAGDPVPRQYDTTIINRSGEIVPVEITGAQTIWHGQPADIVIIRDITRRKRDQAALIQAEKLAITGKLAASLAHEINNPLQTVIGCLGLAEETLAAGGDVNKYLHIGREELRRAASIVGQLRNLGRRPKPEERELTDVRELLDQVLTLSRKQCEDRRVVVEWAAPDDLPPLALVPDRMQQVFLNLVLNALDAMPEGGRLQVSASHGDDPDGIRISFSDSGVGIAQEDLPHIFDPFYSTKPEGLGLGLFVSKNIVEEHGGLLEVDTRLGEGTTFTLWLPT